MRIIARSTLREFWEIHAEAEQALRAWIDDAAQAEWQSPADIKSIYANASILADNRVVFNIKGNDYRLIALIILKVRTIFILFIGTHQEYDKIDASTEAFKK